jgi:streptogramin lyase
MGSKLPDPGRLLHRLGTVPSALFLIALLVAASAGTAAVAATTAQDGTSDVQFPIEVSQGVDGGLATDGEFVYAIADTGDGTDRIVRIDPESEDVVATYDMPFDYGSGLAIADGSLWVSSLQAGEVAEIDLDGSGTVDRFGVTGSPAGVAYVNGSRWDHRPTATRSRGRRQPATR